MYVPRVFREDRTDRLHAAMQEIGAATVVSPGPDGLIATHVPVELDPNPAPYGTVRCHFARANTHIGAICDGQEVLLVFQGPQGYITPNWYPSKQQTAKVVPTWNYVAIHAYGDANLFDGPDRLRSHLGALTARFEENQTPAWSIDDAPDEFIEKQCRAIVGIEIRLARIEGKWKMSQNKPREDRLGVIDGLRALDTETAGTLADLIEQADKRSGGETT